MAVLKPAYLVCGDDDQKIDDWRARVRRRAERDGGPRALEQVEARRDRPAHVRAAAAALTFGMSARYLLVDDVEIWKAGDLDPLERALAEPLPDTVIVLVARGKPPARLATAVEQAGGEVREYTAPKPWELPRWAAERAREHDLNLDKEAAKALVARVGTRPGTVAREVEKLALAAHPRGQLSAEEVVELAAGEAVARAQDLADAVVAGDARAALALGEELLRREGRPGSLLFPLVRRLREVHRASELLDAGLPEQRVAGALKMPPWQAKRTVAQARKANRDALERAICAFAELEFGLRGGDELDEQTGFSLALARAAAG